MALQKRKACKSEKGDRKIREGFFQTEKTNKIARRLFRKFQNGKPDRTVFKKEIAPAVQHGCSDGISFTKSSHSLYAGKVFTKNAKNKEDAILGLGNNGIWKNGMGMPTAFTENSGNRDLLIYSLSMNDINNRTGIGSMDLTVSFGMTDGTHLGFRIKRAHKIKK